MKIVVVSYDFAPHHSPRATRWGAIAEAWADAGHHVDVVTATPDREPPGKPRFRVHRVPGSRLQQARAAHGASATIGVPGPLARLAYKALVKPFQWPDYARGWIVAAAKETRALVSKGCDILVTSSPPFSDHVIGLKAIKMRPRRMVWIADFGDPFAAAGMEPPNNRLLFQRRNRRVERRVMEHADVVTATTPTLADLWRSAFPRQSHKFTVVPPLVPRRERPAGGRFFSATKRSRVVFVGTLYDDLRNPRPILELLRRTHAGGRGWELHLVGEMSFVRATLDRYAEFEGDALRLHGVQPRARAAAAMAESDVLLSIGNASNLQIPSKIFEYLASGKPILHVSSIGDDPCGPLLKKSPAALQLSVEELGTESGQRRALGFILDPPKAAPPSWLQEHAPSAIAMRYLGAAETARSRMG